MPGKKRAKFRPGSIVFRMVVTLMTILSDMALLTVIVVIYQLWQIHMFNSKH